MGRKTFFQRTGVDRSAIAGKIPGWKFYQPERKSGRRKKRACIQKYMADRWGWSRKKVDHFFDQLETENMIKVNKKRASEETSIFIVNYSRYQIFGTGKRASEEQVRNK